MWRLVLSAVVTLTLMSAGGLAADHGRPEQTATAPAHLRPAMTFSPTIQGLEQAQQHYDGAWRITGSVSGTGTIQADDILIEGVLSPGYSPGCINFGGNVTFGITSILITEVGGTTPCTEYDRVDVANQLTINGATLEVILINGFVPAYGDTFDILNWGSLTGSFGAIDTTAATLSYPLQWDTSQLYLTGELIVGVQPIADGDLAPWDAPNGQIDAADVLIATQLALGQRTAGALQLAHGDMNGDGVIDLADLLLIRQIVLQ